MVVWSCILEQLVPSGSQQRVGLGKRGKRTRKEKSCS